MALRMNPYLVTNGNGREAVAFYERALGAKVVHVSTFGEAPGDPNHPIDEGVKDLIMHAHLQVGETPLMISDNYPGQPYAVGNNINVTIVTDDASQAKAIFEALAEGGQVTMPLQETFWSPAYGAVTDRFGVAFQISTESKQ